MRSLVQSSRRLAYDGAAEVAAAPHGGASLDHATQPGRTMRESALLVLAMLSFLPCPVGAESPFAATVLEFAPAPGQFVNHVGFNDPQMALGPPVGAGTSAADNSSVVSLGGFGGFIVLGFDAPVENHPLNPFGVDAIVFGNAFYSGGNPNRHWAECAIIEISHDDNQNGLPDDPWYLIAGSHDPGDDWLAMTWDDDVADATYPPALASWIPPGETGVWMTEGFELPSGLFGNMVLVNPSSDSHIEGIHGYAEYSPTLLLGDLTGNNVVDDPAMLAGDFYVVPDDPYVTGITPGSGGGDAFDIAWAIDPATGAAAELSAFHFIRLTTGVDADFGFLGELSSEIDGVSDVVPDFFGDVDHDEDIDLSDVADLQVCFDLESVSLSVCDDLDRENDDLVDHADATLVLGRMTGPLGID